ncbi:hypothetical protein I8751_27515 [Nostocaceae cyanobacterium CENA357]|uniref:Zinc ribbon domain-containing protein n=1 Tax=Atlanticothrix silvestris CENA357 TaxID=1725252 RepID=A0A8J7HMR0_9CYAN|nr:hypothetical protein [Atlanticothrix silvestris]MBH8556024.1 hypothetical protein [Atlanticothrix silvestris CENA357]
MFAQFRRSLSQFFNKSKTINNEPLNKVSLVVIILIDIFILINVFTGLDDISRWYLSPLQTYPCYSEWQNYQTQNTQDKDYKIIQLSLSYNNTQPSQQQIYQQTETDHLGKVSTTCLKYAEYQEKINNSKNQQNINLINQKQTKINTLKQANSSIRQQYDSTLLEKIAGQPREQSINQVSAEKAKIELEQNNRNISTLEKEITNLKNELLSQPETSSFIAFLKDKEQFATLKKGYQQASFWYPSIQLAFQSIFLLPLIFVALLVHSLAQRKGYGLITLISWHLLIIFFIPLILKVFEFLQIGVLFEFIIDIISVLFGRLLFLVSYIYILLVPLIGFGIIKFFQKVVFNPQVQAISRVQKSSCIQCAKKIRQNDIYCPYCGYEQYVECQNCHELTYRKLSHCKHCGYLQDSNNL